VLSFFQDQSERERDEVGHSSSNQEQDQTSSNPADITNPDGNQETRNEFEEKEDEDTEMFDEQTGSGGALGLEHDYENLQQQEANLNTLERIFLFAKSEMAYHRVLVSRQLAEWIVDVELNEAVEYVIPLLNGLGTDGEWDSKGKPSVLSLHDLFLTDLSFFLVSASRPS